MANWRSVAHGRLEIGYSKVMDRLHRAIAASYCFAVIAFCVGYYVSVRGAAPDTSLDWTTPLLALGLLSLLVGVAFGRWRVLFLPFVAVPVVFSLFVLASVDDRYRHVAPGSGAPVGGVDWAGYGAVVLTVTVPALAFGLLLVTIGRRLSGRLRRRLRRVG